MYCAKCGVKLADTEKVCPLCGLKAYHPDIERGKCDPLYPLEKYPAEMSSRLAAIILTVVFTLPLLVVLWCDLQFNRSITWSGYVMGALALGYIICVLPMWFRNPNPVIFVPCDFAAILLYLLYIDLRLQVGWFMSFAFPVTGGVALIFTAVTVLIRYIKRGRLYIFGGALIALGAFTLLTELLLTFTFEHIRFVGWSLYPLIVFVIIGGLLIFLAIYRPARETMERKFFI